MDIKLGPFEIFFGTIGAVCALYFLCYGITKLMLYYEKKKIKTQGDLMTKKKCEEQQKNCPNIDTINEKIEKLLVGFDKLKEDRKNEIQMIEVSYSNQAAIKNCMIQLTVYLLKKSDQEGQDLMHDILEQMVKNRKEK